jgi:hypothetical protein
MANAQNPTKLTETASEINQTAGRAQLGENPSNEWCEPMTNEEYSKL